MLDGQGCLLPVRHFHREDTPLMLSSWSGLCTTCRVEASAETSPNPNPNPNPPHSPSLEACPCSSSSEVESGPAHSPDSLSELLNPTCSKSCHCLPASHIAPEPARAWDCCGEPAGEGVMPCTSLEFDCSSASPSRSAQDFPFLPAQEAETSPAQTGSGYGEFEEVHTDPRTFLEGDDGRSTENSRSSDAEVDSNKIVNEEEIFFESAGAVYSSVGDEETSKNKCEDGEDSMDRTMKSGSWRKQEAAEAMQSQENNMGAVDNSGVPEDFSRYRENKESELMLEIDEGQAKDSEDAFGNASVVEGNSVSTGSSSRSASMHNSRFVDADDKGVKRLRIASSDEISLADSMAMLADGPAGQVTCNSPHDDVQQQPLLPGLDRETALRCLAFVPLSDLGRLSMVGRQYRDLVKSRDIFNLRRIYGMVEHLVFIYISGADFWTAYEANRNVWVALPPANVPDSFKSSDRESLSAGTHVLWLGKELFEFVYYRYDLLTSSWERGPSMVNARCLFASASCGEFAFVAGGFGPTFSLLNTAERYNSLTGIWEPLPPMSTARQKCSGFFMDGKFYVIGGRDVHHQPIMSGEEYNPTTGVWRTIPNMYFTPEVSRSDMLEPSPPLVAVVNNELYAVENTTNVLKMYNKNNNNWGTLGPLPVRADLRNGWGVAFKSLGSRLFVMGDADGIAAFSWRPGSNPTEPVWQRLYHRERGNGFLYNCAVMAC